MVDSEMLDKNFKKVKSVRKSGLNLVRNLQDENMHQNLYLSMLKHVMFLSANYMKIITQGNNEVRLMRLNSMKQIGDVLVMQTKLGRCSSKFQPLEQT